MTSERLTGVLAAFLQEIGISVRWAALAGPTVLPGVAIERGVLVIDTAKLLYPGDVLHEAGHLAVVPPTERAVLGGDAGPDPASEMMAIAWSWAAVEHLGLDPSVVFHPDGYRGGSASLIENFRAGRYLAVPMLQWAGMAVDAQRGAELGIEPYPRMIRWLRE